MKLEQSFEVQAPLERVWQALIDVEHVAPCLPGASVTGRNEDGSYDGAFTVKIGPTTASYTGKLEMEQVDEDAHTATMQANGTDRRGQGGAKATITSKLAEADGGTRVEVVTDYHITGRLARFGRGGMIEDISERLLTEFAQRLQASLTTGEPEAAAEPAAGEPEVESEAAAEPEVEAEPDAEPEQTTTEAADGPAAEEPPVATEAPAAATEEPAAAAEEPEPAAAAGEPAAAAEEPEPAAAAGETAAAAGEPATTAEEPRAVPPPPPPPRPRPVEPAEPLDAGSLVTSVMWDRVRKNPAPVAFVLGVLLALRVMRRRRRR
jgi:uncharacterized protein